MAEIKVVITDETGSKSESSVSTPQEQAPTPIQSSKKADVKTKEAALTKQNSQGLAIAAMIGSKALNYTTSNVGKWTGNSQNQQLVNTIQQGIGLAAIAYVNPALALATASITMTTTAIDNYYELKWAKASSENKLAQAGYDSNGNVVGRRH